MFQFDSIITDGSETVSPGEEIRFLNLPQVEAKVGEIGEIEFSTKFTNSKGLLVTIHSLNDLPEKGTGGTTDPYVKVKLIKDDTRKEHIKHCMGVLGEDPEGSGVKYGNGYRGMSIFPLPLGDTEGEIKEKR